MKMPPVTSPVRNARRTSVILLILGALIHSSSCDWSSGPRTPHKEGKEKKAAESIEVKPVAFHERNEDAGDVYNASDLVAVGDGRFLFVDNNTNDALLELSLTPDGQQAAPIAKRPLVGIEEGAIDDIEDLALAEESGRKYVFASPSLSIKPGSKRKGKEQKIRPGGLVRITVAADGTLSAQNMPGFRDWFVDNVPAIKSSAENDPDFGGLNVEGLEWDPARHALLFGIRTPVVGHEPIVVPVRVKQLDGPWDVSNLEAMPTIKLDVEHEKGDQGIRGIATGPGGSGFLLTIGNATSADQAPFSLYQWDGSDDGKAVKLPVTFEDKMKPEGLTVATVGGRSAIVFSDDRGGFAVLWLDELAALRADA